MANVGGSWGLVDAVLPGLARHEFGLPSIHCWGLSCVGWDLTCVG
jgi:hypothetical protein